MRILILIFFPLILGIAHRAGKTVPRDLSLSFTVRSTAVGCFSFGPSRMVFRKRLDIRGWRGREGRWNELQINFEFSPLKFFREATGSAFRFVNFALLSFDFGWGINFNFKALKIQRLLLYSWRNRNFNNKSLNTILCFFLPPDVIAIQ